ncbi:hypothetical protein RIF29_31129 [Crotalaria pallida]|uniref:Uncharacterized protein n=1 Tax=Crotalaria pallida TaxID=3830 RepID=A0AAN9EH70_CROPI
MPLFWWQKKGGLAVSLFHFYLTLIFPLHFSQILQNIATTTPKPSQLTRRQHHRRRRQKLHGRRREGSRGYYF